MFKAQLGTFTRKTSCRNSELVLTSFCVVMKVIYACTNSRIHNLALLAFNAKAMISKKKN